MIGVGVCVSVGTTVSVGVLVGIAVGVCVAVAVAVGTLVGTGVSDGLFVAVGIGVLDGLFVAVGVAVFVGVLVSVGVGALPGVSVGTPAVAGTGEGVAEAVADATGLVTGATGTSVPGAGVLLLPTGMALAAATVDSVGSGERNGVMVWAEPVLGVGVAAGKATATAAGVFSAVGVAVAGTRTIWLPGSGSGVVSLKGSTATGTIPTRLFGATGSRSAA